LGATDAVSLNLKLFASHVSILPLLLVALIAGHFYLVHVLNLSPLPFGADSGREQVPADRMTGTLGEHTRSILLYGAIYFSLVVVICWLIPAPLGEAITGEEKSIKPPWPFLWLYGMENLTGRMDTLFYGTAVFLFLLALVPLTDRGPERNPLRRKGTMAAGALILFILLGLTLYAAINPPQMHHHEPNGMTMEHEGMTEPMTMPPTENGALKDNGHAH
jgi:quinol-cytochrome oxidoreductase complex cytochrome b subunit